MDKAGLKSFSFEIEKNIGTPTGNTAKVDNIFSIPNNGITVISPMTHNVLLRKVCVYATASPRTSSNNAGLVNALNFEFNVVDFAGQIIKLGYPFINLFAPEVGLKKQGLHPYSMNLDHFMGTKDICVVGGGITTGQIGVGLSGLNTSVDCIVRVVVTVFYEDL